MLRGLIAQGLVSELLPTEQELELAHLLQKKLLRTLLHIQDTWV
jgi:hypothetical protein